ncbi:MAG: DNA mismatch repair endonuclease MutL [Deltaproteobacteria bacterium]|nr:DNA mismatch repair endonuclease MutL [Deltaproteobacteria bacterium]MBW1929694.1 DNA mismatch repair endonuclease MutL [Deltaproteobacteria bacterium]MBW2023984.1 DNA mismatch repair endonuclease MutL [Deltaproteobacteria bacterium]MBW2124689.1 DNA mismatch repair endonuclease MutL [Deltaproteobacteria bacterium]
MSRIRILSEEVATQIAAGEVIERPSSVVRELVDNSIDAGADRIRVRIEGGGKSLIRVSDNGIGMSRDDLLLSIERHATSKILSVEDLFAISSLGFRGEALPSIASVSRMRITSKVAEAVAGHTLKISGGKLEDIEETGAPEGTTVEVRDLFYNVPARKKFLKGERTEADKIIDTFSRLALAFENIYFQLENEQKLLINLPSSEQLIPRLAILFGRSVAEGMVQETFNKSGLSMTVYAAPAEFSRSRADRIYVYVNRRNVKDRLINRAIMDGYGQRLMKGAYPQVVLFIETEPSQVDVNVHPAKQEVRFRQPGLLFQSIMRLVDSALGRRIHIYPGSSTWDREGEVQEPVEVRWEPSSPATKPVSFPLTTDSVQVPLFDEQITVIGQLNRTYILCQDRNGLMIVDQHAAHERVLYEKLMEQVKKSGLEVQNLLVPKRIDLSVSEKRTLEKRGEVLSELGIDVEDFGGEAVLLRAVPSMLENADWDQLLVELIGALKEGPVDKGSILEHVITIMACHGAIRAGHTMSMAEMTALLAQLNRLRLPTNCPHGRPITRTITYYELERMFKRVV